MPCPRLIAAVFMTFFTVFLTAQDHSTCDYIVKKVWFESASGLTSAQLQKLHSLVEGRCYDPAKPDSVSKYVYDQLRQWGHRKVEVDDPHKFQVVDESVHPSPVTFVIDFRMNDP